MARPLRILYPGAYYHVMNRGTAKQNIFLSDRDRYCFLNCLEEAHRQFNIIIHAYCLMGNHYHLLVSTPDGNLSRNMRHINGTYTQRFNKRNHRDGPIFRGRYLAILVEDSNYLANVSRYIHLNPVADNFSKTPEEYFWSSYRYYLSNLHEPTWLSSKKILSLFGNDNDSLNRVDYIGFITKGVDEETQLFYSLPNTKAILGSQEYIEACVSTLDESDFEFSGAEIKLLKETVLLDEIVKVVSNYYDVDINSVTKRVAFKKNQPRDISMYIARYHFGYFHKQLAEFFRYRKVTSLSARVCLIRKNIESSQVALNEIDEIIKMIKSGVK